ncbi:peptidyl-prolyl cis-trans isomerase [Brevibacillus centrosporus]|uniref:peptidylprolyl isomerase n=1 Tax=Brevibacillus centrosporus TaxID=54910 RepID=A0A1I4E9B8_9BACL|nr:peptidyl-prolyl cis-trans isomerase [Brevibacillus centrosporus]MED4911988.1 peptidyl-prolyl cis-trans isomerase [Brevibacillus centrosporus]SFL00956.1 foldase protein PrsA [Brevibacillus centrosporus]
MTNTKGLWAFIGALVVLLLVVTWSWYQTSTKLQPAAVVGGSTISEADYISALKQKFGDQVLQDMVNREVVFQAAKQQGVTVDQAELDQEMAQIRESYGSSSDSEFEQALIKQAGTTVEALRREITYQLLLQALATKDIVISDEELLTFYNNHPERYARPMQMRLWQIVVATQQEAEQVAAELKQGANFQALAKERSIDSLTSGNGGDMGWLSLGDSRLPDEAQDVVADLETKKISAPMKVKENYVIYQMADRRKAEQQSFEQVKEAIRKELAFAQVESLDEVLDRLRQSVGVEISEQMQH